MISLARSGDPIVRTLLANHPHVLEVAVGDGPGVQFLQDGWERRVDVGRPSEELYGLIEIMDNNPIVCADAMSVPGPAATLSLIALAPLAQSGIIADSPAVIVNFGADESEVTAALGRVHWNEGVAFHVEPVELDGVLTATIMVSIKTPDDLDEIDLLFDECYERSFYVLREDESGWETGLVRGKAHAAYRLRISPDEPNSLLTVRVMADSNGKCGAAQVVHAMNVMCGFEESLGIT